MFTVAAQQELLKRLNENPEFSDLRDLVKITTLNAWGWDRVNKMDSVCNANLIYKDHDKFSLAKNDLKPVWKRYEKIKQVIKNKKKNKFPKELINIIDDFKSLGFDDLDHSDFNKFSSHVDRICRHNIGRELFYKNLSILKDYEILARDINANAYPENIYPLSDLEKEEIYNSFFQFWKDSCEHSLDIDKFTYEDQKYVACHNEEKQLNENKFSSGSAKYNYIFVDEFQDINFLDLRLIKVIAKRNHATLTIIGDDDQAIFEWRGASSKYILSPNQFFDLSFKEYKLAVNYRSPENIIEHSQRLIENNSNRVRKEISSTISEEANIEVHKITGGFTENLKFVQEHLNKSFLPLLGF